MSGPNAHTVPAGPFCASVEYELEIAAGLVAAGLLLFFPIASFALSAFLLVNLHDRTSPHARVLLGLVLAVSLAMMTGARPIDPQESNDIEGYHLVYQALAEGDLEALTHFGGGLEVGLPLLMMLWATVLPPLSPNGLMFCLSLTGALLMLLWVERRFYAGRGPRSPALLGICIVMLNLYFATQLARQFLSLVVLLYAFTAHGPIRKTLWLVVAASFHLTALPFFGLYVLARRGLPGWLAIVLAALAFRIYFAELLGAFDVLPPALAEKLVYYMADLDELGSPDIASLRMIGLLGAISLVVLLSTRMRPSPAVRPWLALPWITALVHVLLLPVPLASMRATLMVHSVAPGFIVFKMLAGRPGPLLLAVLNVLLLYKIGSFATAPQSANLASSLAMLSGFLL